MFSSPAISPLEVEAIREATAENLAEVLDEHGAHADIAWLERGALMLLPAFDDPDMPDEARQALPDALEERADRPAATMLAALRDYGRAPLARMAGAALERLAARGIEATAPGEGGELALDEVRHSRVGDGEVMLATVRRPGENGVQAALVELEHWESGPVVVGGILTEPVSAAEARAHLDRQPAEMAVLEREDAVVTLKAALDHMAAHDLALPGELCPVVPILARALTGDAHGLGEPHYELPDGGPEDIAVDEPYVVDAAEDEDGFFAAVAELRDGFEAYANATIAPPSPVLESGDFVVSSLLEWKGGYADGRLVHWTRGAIAEYLLEFFPRKVTADDELIAQTPACVAAFLEFLAAEELLVGDPVGELSTFCRELAVEFEAACRDQGNWGLAKSMGAQMLADGVDLGDEHAVEAWMTDFNARPRAERDRVVGPAMDRMVAGAGAARPPSSAGARRAKRKATRTARKRNRR